MRNRFVSMDRMPRRTPPKYRTTNWSKYYAALKSRGSLEVWFDPRIGWFSVPSGRPGRPMRFTDQAIEFCLTLKGLSQLPLRQVTGLTQSLLRLSGLGRYVLPLSSGSKFTFQADFHYNSNFFFTVVNAPDEHEKNYTVVNMRLAYEPSDGRLGIAVFGRDILSEKYGI